MIPNPQKEPFLFVSPDANAALLCVHGLTSTPYSMRELGAALSSPDLSVYSILLPGHGTHSDDLATKRWEDWYEAVKSAVRELKKKYNRIFLCGQSLGSLLILLTASEIPCTGLICISAGLRFRNRWIHLLPIIRLFKKSIHKSNGADIKDPKGRVSEIHYSEIPLKSIHEMLKLLKIVKKRLASVHIPILWFTANDDHVFDRKSMDEAFFITPSNDKTAIILNNSYHVATMDYDRHTIIDHSRIFIQRIMQNTLSENRPMTAIIQ